MDLEATRGRFGRREFLAGGAGAAAAGLAALARPSRADADRAALPLLPRPQPIPGGLPLGLPAPYDLIHIFLPGPTDITLPFSGSQLMGLDVERRTTTESRGATVLSYLIGSAVGSDGVEYDLEADLRVFRGPYVAADGSKHRGSFAMI